jgi:hypothetical protein
VSVVSRDDQFSGQQCLRVTQVLIEMGRRISIFRPQDAFPVTLLFELLFGDGHRLGHQLPGQAPADVFRDNTTVAPETAIKVRAVWPSS